MMVMSRVADERQRRDDERTTKPAIASDRLSVRS